MLELKLQIVEKKSIFHGLSMERAIDSCGYAQTDMSGYELGNSSFLESRLCTNIFDYPRKN